MPERKRQIAIITNDTIRYLGLYQLLSVYFAPVSVSRFGSFETFAAEGADGYEYYLTSPETFLLNADFFLPRKNKTMVWVEAREPDANSSSFSWFLPVSLSQEALIERLQDFFASEWLPATAGEGGKELSGREIEVLQLIVRGAINKEIADRLSISLNTVLTHRKNITAKLGIKTVPGLTFYALMNGYISADDIEL